MLLTEGPDQLLEVITAPRFNRAKTVDRGDIRPGERAVMGDVPHAGPGACNGHRQFGQSSGPIADRNRKPAQTPIGNQPYFDDFAEDARINISSAKEQDHIPPCEVRQPSGKKRSQG